MKCRSFEGHTCFEHNDIIQHNILRSLFHFSQFLNFEWNFCQTHSFLRQQTQAAQSNAAKERISSMISKIKQAVAVLYFEWRTIVHYVSEDTY